MFLPSVIGDEKSLCPLFLGTKAENTSAIPPLFAISHNMTHFAVYDHTPGAVTRAPRLPYSVIPFGSPSQAHSPGYPRCVAPDRSSLKRILPVTSLAHRFIVKYYNHSQYICQGSVNKMLKKADSCKTTIPAIPRSLTRQFPSHKGARIYPYCCVIFPQSSGVRAPGRLTDYI